MNVIFQQEGMFEVNGRRQNSLPNENAGCLWRIALRQADLKQGFLVSVEEKKYGEESKSRATTSPTS